MKTTKQEVQIELEILPSGGIRFARRDKETNLAMMEFLTDLVDTEGLDEFFGQADNVKLLVGKEVLCG